MMHRRQEELLRRDAALSVQNSPSRDRVAKTLPLPNLLYRLSKGSNALSKSQFNEAVAPPCARSHRCESSAQVLHVGPLHIAEVLVLTAHGPAERVVRRPGARVDRPSRREHGLLIAQNDSPDLVRSPHQMKHDVIIVEVKVEVDLRTTLVCMRRHSVPDASGLQLGHYLLKLR